MMGGEWAIYPPNAQGVPQILAQGLPFPIETVSLDSHTG